jgi:hypothetical protein
LIHRPQICARQTTARKSTLAVGSHTIQASYSGDGTFAGSDAALTQIVNTTNTTPTTTTLVSQNPSTFGQSVSFTATAGAGGTPTGSVLFVDQTTSQTLGTVTLSGGVATITTSTLIAGTHIIQATYGSDTTFGGSTASVKQVVNAAGSTIALASSQNPNSFGQSVTYSHGLKHRRYADWHRDLHRCDHRPTPWQPNAE